MWRRTTLVLVSLAVAAAAPAKDFDVDPWLADLEQVRQAFHSKYANLEWLQREREIDVDALFENLEARLRDARTDQEARAVFERLERRVADGHVAIDWPQPVRAGANSATPAPGLCASLGYDARENSAGTAQALPGYRPLPTGGNPFNAGIVTTTGATVGVIRIGVFQPHGYPQLCSDALAALSIPPEKPCDDVCQDQVITWGYRRMGQSLEQRIDQLRTAGAEVLLVDITNNGGGSEWVEAAARMLSPRPLTSARHGFVRGEHWAKQWRGLAARLRDFAANAATEDRTRLLAWAAQAEAAAVQAESPCGPNDARCSTIVSVGHSTGLVGNAPSGAFDGKSWGVHVFNPAQHYYRDSAWTGPLMVLANEETWSAAEQFAAVLQDNRAGVIVGARTGGAGCGYTWGGHPTKLENSGAILKLPDCVRFRADGSNEVRGVIPDVLVGFRARDGAMLRARLLAERLPEAIALARALVPER